MFRSDGISGGDPRYNDIASDNQVNGKPLHAYKDCAGLNLDGIPVGQLIVAGCRGVRLANLEITDTWHAVQLISVEGVLLDSNNFSYNHAKGITISDSNFLTITRNIISHNQQTGLDLGGSLDVAVAENTIAWNGRGISSAPSNATMYHNTFLNNTAQADSGLFGSPYPRGGNYWSDYTGVDNCSGASQNVCPDPDGIGGTPNVVRDGSGGPIIFEDRYPRMSPYSPPTDNTRPSWPSGTSFTTSDLTSTSLSLSWTPASDNVEVIAYAIKQGPTVIAYLPASIRNFAVNGLSQMSMYTFTVEAGDISGNWSESQTLTVTTPLDPLVTAGIVVAIILAAVGAGIYLFRRKKHMNRGHLAPQPTPPAHPSQTEETIHSPSRQPSHGEMIGLHGIARRS